MNRYQEFKNLHKQKTPLLLGNVWDVPSAKVMEELGFKALGTSSAAIAATLGYEDGENLSFDELLFMVGRISKSTNIPLSVDIESGYGDSVEQIVKNILTLEKLGVVGINIEDSVANGDRDIIPAEAFQKTLSEIISLLKKENSNVFINARTDTYLLNMENKRVETLKRISLYEEVGVNGIFVPCITDLADISILTKSTELPINVMCMPNLPNFKELEAAGVKRISMGNFMHNALLNSLKGKVEQVLANQSFNSIVG